MDSLVKKASSLRSLKNYYYCGNFLGNLGVTPNDKSSLCAVPWCVFQRVFVVGDALRVQMRPSLSRNLHPILARRDLLGPGFSILSKSTENERLFEACICKKD